MVSNVSFPYKPIILYLLYPICILCLNISILYCGFQYIISEQTYRYQDTHFLSGIVLGFVQEPSALYKESPVAL